VRKRRSSAASHYTPKEEKRIRELQAAGGRKGAATTNGRMTREQRVARAAHAVACRRAKEKAREAYVMERVEDKDVYISEEEFDALE